MTLPEILDLQEVTKWTDLWKLVSRLLLDLGVAWFIIQVVYLRRSRRDEYVFTFYMFNVITFLLCLLLRKVPAELGFALALFGVFGILRYRTEAIKIRELTFLFTLIGIGIVNAVVNTSVSVPELLAVNLTVAMMSWWLEGRRGSPETSRPLRYDKLALIAPDKREALLDDLAERLGFRPHHVEIRSVDLLRDAADLTIYFRDEKPHAAMPRGHG